MGRDEGGRPGRKSPRPTENLHCSEGRDAREEDPPVEAYSSTAEAEIEIDARMLLDKKAEESASEAADLRVILDKKVEEPSSEGIKKEEGQTQDQTA